MTIGMEICAGRPEATLHMKPASISHVEEQPSPSRTLPSSQASSAKTMPSPHCEVQGPCEQSGSASQNGLQPSPRSVLPSSHCSDPSATPSPQTVASHGSPGTSQWKLGSRLQRSSQPSPDRASHLPWVQSPSSTQALPSPHCLP